MFNSLKIRIRQRYAKTGLYRFVLRLCSQVPLLADVWYFFTGEIRREAQAVLAGRITHLEQARSSELNGAVYTLRRNTHRIEKGLIMKPRRDVFAKFYIGETVQMFSGLAKKYSVDGSNKETLQWANDVLGEYFSIVASDPLVDTAKADFLDVKLGFEQGDKRPYRRQLSTPSDVTLEQMKNLAIRRRSCRWFLPQKVPREMIDRAVEVAGYSPSACNRQPFEFRFFDDQKLIQQVAEIPMGTAGFAHNFPCIAAVVGDFTAFPFDRDRHVPYIDGSLATMALQFALEVQGLSSCCINWPDIEFREQKMAKLLSLQKYQRVVMLVAIGFPDPNESVPYSQKKPIAEIRSYNKL